MYPVQRMLFTCSQRHKESTHQLGILFRGCCLLAAKDIRNQHIYQVSCLEHVVYLQPKKKGINTSIRYPVQRMLFTCSQRHKESTHLLGIMFRRCWCTCCQRHQESTHLLGFLVRRCWCNCCQRHQESTLLLDILFRRCWVLAAKDIRNQHIYQVSYLGNVGYLLPKTQGINTSIRYPVQRVLFTCSQRHKESTHLLGILFRGCCLLAAKDIRNQHIYQVSCLGDVGVLAAKDIRNQHIYQVSWLGDVGVLAAKDIRNQRFYQISCLGDAGYLLPKT